MRHSSATKKTQEPIKKHPLQKRFLWMRFTSLFVELLTISLVLWLIKGVFCWMKNAQRGPLLFLTRTTKWTSFTAKSGRLIFVNSSFTWRAKRFRRRSSLRIWSKCVIVLMFYCSCRYLQHNNCRQYECNCSFCL